MNDFTASNGIIVDRVGADDEWTVDPLGKHARVSRAQMNALREFFQAEADERLCRWRDPAQPEFLVYPVPGDGSRVHVVDETTGVHYGASRDSARDGHGSAAHYFDAHPEPKPWHEAKPGEVWIVGSSVVTWEGDQPMIVNEDGEFQNYTWTFLVNDHEITHARRIWPEVSS